MRNDFTAAAAAARRPNVSLRMGTPEPLVHVIREAAGEPEGALVLLHGRGADEHDLSPCSTRSTPSAGSSGSRPARRCPVPAAGAGGTWCRASASPIPRRSTATYAQLTAFLDGWLAERDDPLGARRSSAASRWAASCPTRPALGAGRPSPAGLLAMSGFIPTVEGWEPELDSRARAAGLHHARRARPGHLRRVRAATRAAAWRRPASTSTTTSTAAAITSIPRQLPAMRAWLRTRTGAVRS